MNNRAAAAVIAVFLLVAVVFGSPVPSGADSGTADSTTVVESGR